MDKQKKDNDINTLAKGDDDMENIIARPKTVTEKLRNGILDMKLMEQGRKHKTTWEEFKNEFQNELKEYEGNK